MATARWNLRDHASTLVGRTIHTLSNRSPNRIVAVEAGGIIVATARSPDGQLVPFAMLDDAAEKLANEGTIEISVGEVGHRSAFVGAFLSTLPGVAHAGGARLSVDDSVVERGTRAWLAGLAGESEIDLLGLDDAPVEFGDRAVRPGDLVFVVGPTPGRDLVGYGSAVETAGDVQLKGVGTVRMLRVLPKHVSGNVLATDPALPDEISLESRAAIALDGGARAALLDQCRRATLATWQRRRTEADEFVERIIPSPGRPGTLAFVARSVAKAEQEAPTGDHVFALRRQNDTSFALYVGHHHVLSIWHGGLFVYVDRAVLGDDAYALLADGDRPTFDEGPKGIAPSAGFRFDYEEVAERASLIRPAHDRFIEHAATLPISAHHKKADAALLDVLRKPLGA